MTTPVADPKKRRWTIIVTVMFVSALVMGTGPGVMLVNSPEPIMNFPPVYLWGLLWYAVEVLSVLLAYFMIWRKTEDPT